MSNTEVNDILFYVIYATVADKMKKKELTFSDIKELDLETITNENVLSVANRIYEKYKELGGNRRIAKSKTFIEDVYSLFEL